MINKPTVGIFSGSASTSLSQEVAKILGLNLGNIDLGKFSDGEIKVEILENVEVMKHTLFNLHVPQRILI
jgi:ribose-phosphate pyrophosphokinase